ncbi:MAG: preprotein translocase subunit SecG [Deltaproteobacteria bacterium]|nr:preprotein translocase subunit SecG [Deltaproteobacteria bacterium]
MNLLETLSPFILAVHITICIFLVVVILLQAGKGADMGAAFGAGSSQTLFGARGAATFLSKLTTVTALLFLVTSVSLAMIHRNRTSLGGSRSVVGEEAPAPAPIPETAPTPAPLAPVQTPPNP